ncbi:hypothetical protein [Dyella sp.]|uniref:hypothetical protein n=1 Tax=Dyella sp. TaxID=1869338 RepID=UPI002FD8B133
MHALSGIIILNTADGVSCSVLRHRVPLALAGAKNEWPWPTLTTALARAGLIQLAIMLRREEGFA